ncbi:MAG TPA: hypothetical protein VFP72_15875 [Kineosporiaceae bacterium]|nr:hypothetical protein [Kineosporiaceae bacterium]
MKTHRPPGLLRRLRAGLVSVAAVLAMDVLALAVPVAAPAQAVSLCARAARTGASEGFRYDAELRRLLNEAVQTRGLEAFLAADTAMRALTPCNAPQAAAQEAMLDFLGWLAAEGACKEQFYNNAKNISDVNQWLACAGPALAGLASRKQYDQMATLSTPCDPQYRATPPGQTRGMVMARLITVTRQVAASVKAVKNLATLAKLTGRGIRVLIDDGGTDAEAHAVVYDITLYAGKKVAKPFLQGQARKAGRTAASAVLEPLGEALTMDSPDRGEVRLEVHATSPDGTTQSTAQSLTLTGS